MHQLEVGLPWASGNLFQFECCGHLNRLSPSCLLLATSSPSATWMPARYLQQHDLSYVPVCSCAFQGTWCTSGASLTSDWSPVKEHVLRMICVFFEIAEMLNYKELINFSAWFLVQGCPTFAPLSCTRELRGQRIQQALNRHGAGAMQRKELVGKTSGKSHVEGSRYQNYCFRWFILFHRLKCWKGQSLYCTLQDSATLGVRRRERLREREKRKKKLLL